MAGIYKRFAGAASNQSLITKGSGVSGNIKKILITNEDSAITKVLSLIHI